MFTVISLVIEKESQREELKTKDGRSKVLWVVTNVPRHLQVEVAFGLTSRPTVRSRDTIVHSATSHLAKLVIWRGTPLFTPERNHTNVHNATIQPIRLSIRESTLRITGERNWRNANNAIILQLGQTVWSTTKGTHSEEKPHRCTTCEFFSN